MEVSRLVRVCLGWGQSDGRSYGRIGYSWHANQYGLTIDTVDAFELVLPNGTVTNVTASQADLFFGLKVGFPVRLILHRALTYPQGGFNNFVSTRTSGNDFGTTMAQCRVS